MSLRGNPSHTFKMILLGESGSGKSCLFHRIIYDHYKYAGTYENKTTTPTASGGLANVHYENHTKEVALTGNLRVNVKLFDTGGGERAKSMTQQYYKNAQIVCLVYAMDSEISFNTLGRWLEDARFYLEENQRYSKMVFALVGVKSDIPQYERDVKPDDVRQAAQHFNISEDCCFEVSNISGDGVSHMMQHLAQKAFYLHTRQTSQSTTELQNYSSTEYNEQHDTITVKGPTHCLYYFCCCFCCCRGVKQRGYQELTA